MPKIDTYDIEALTGANYFVIGRGTEGGSASYQLSIAGITGVADPHWGKASNVKADSGYSIGAIQVDLGKRGTWALGATTERAPGAGERAYVDAIIEESEKFAKEHNLSYSPDKMKLRGELLTHGNGQESRGALVFIEKETCASLNAWASSKVGQSWIHRNIDYPQIRHATEAAMALLDKYGRNIPEGRRFEVIAILAKTENQMPQKMNSFEKVLKNGGGYDEVMVEAAEIANRFGYYDGLKAGDLAAKYELAYEDPQKAAAMYRAQAKVASMNFDPVASANDLDIQAALHAIGQMVGTQVLREGSRGEGVIALQADLSKLGVTDNHGRALYPDGAFGSRTREAVEAFQRTHGLAADGRVGTRTLQALQEAVRPREATLADRSHPGYALFCQALAGVHRIDAKCGRAPDVGSHNLAGSLATAAHAQGLARIDQVLLGENATRAFAVQGDPGSPFRQVAFVDVLPAIAKPLEQSSAEFRGPVAETPRLDETALLQPPAQSVLPQMQR